MEHAIVTHLAPVALLAGTTLPAIALAAIAACCAASTSDSCRTAQHWHLRFALRTGALSCLPGWTLLELALGETQPASPTGGPELGWLCVATTTLCAAQVELFARTTRPPRRLPCLLALSLLIFCGCAVTVAADGWDAARRPVAFGVALALLTMLQPAWTWKAASERRMPERLAVTGVALAPGLVVVAALAMGWSRALLPAVCVSVVAALLMPPLLAGRGRR
jgi:hypothetical protein